MREPSLRELATSDGVLCVLALDHRDALRNAFRRVGVEQVTERTIFDLKGLIADALASNASAIMLDPAAVPCCRPAHIGLVVPLEEQGHLAHAGGRLTPLLERFGPAEAAALGADCCKLLLYYRADHAETAAPQRALLDQVVTSCKRSGLPLAVEPLVYRLEGEDESAYADAFPALVVAAARDLADSGADMLKLQFPGDASLCEKVSEAAAPLPWVLLGGSEVDFETFVGQLETTCRAGASGFMAGRAIWAGALALPREMQSDWLRVEARPRFDHIAAIATRHGRRIQ